MGLSELAQERVLLASDTLFCLVREDEREGRSTKSCIGESWCVLASCRANLCRRYCRESREWWEHQVCKANGILSIKENSTAHRSHWTGPWSSESGRQMDWRLQQCKNLCKWPLPSACHVPALPYYLSWFADCLRQYSLRVILRYTWQPKNNPLSVPLCRILAHHSFWWA